MIQALFTQYLRAGCAPSGAEAVAEPLEDRWPFESAALRYYARHRAGWVSDLGTSATRVYAGPVPPDCDVGTVWFDTCELTSMMLLPAYVEPADRDHLSPEAIARLPRESTWFATRPVARFQYGAFLDAAPIDPQNFDRERTLTGDPFEAVTHIACGQAGTYLSWFGKHFADGSVWMAALAHGLSPWAQPAREWAGGCTFDDDYCVVLSPDTLGTDPEDTEGTTDPTRRMLFRHGEVPADVTFRSSVPILYGVNDRDGHVGDGPWRLGARLRRRPREG